MSAAWTIHILTTTAKTPDGEFFLAVARLGTYTTQRYARTEKKAIAFALRDLAEELTK